MTNKRDQIMVKNTKISLSFLLVLVIIGIALAVYFRTKKSETPKTLVKPEFAFDANAKKTINPEESIGSQEGYRIIEYAENDLERSKLIDLTLSWTNGNGYDSVNKLIFTRYVGDNEIQDKIEITKDDFPAMLKDYGNGSITFKGSDVKKIAKGVNEIKAYWNEFKEDNWLATAQLEITEADFNYTYTGPFGDLTVPVTIVGDTFKLEKSVKKTYYQISHEPGRWFNVEETGNGTIKFRFDDGNFLKFGDKDTFKLLAYKNKSVLTAPDGQNIWIPNKKMWKPISEFTKEDYRFAQCDLMGANTIMSSDELLTPDDNKLWKSPNGEWRAVFQNDGNFVVYKENDSNNTVSAATDTQDQGSAILTLSANGNIAFKKANGTTLVKSSGGWTFAEKQGLKPPFRFIVSDFGGLHVISKEGTEVMSRVHQFFGPLSDYYKTHTGDMWGFDISPHHGSSFRECAAFCDKEIKCAGFTYSYPKTGKDQDAACWIKNYESRLLGVASNNDQNADRWSNTKKGGGTDWIGKTQYYQKKIDTSCYRDRYPDLKSEYGNSGENLFKHYYSKGIAAGLDPKCDFTVPDDHAIGYYEGKTSVDTSGFKNVTKLTPEECADLASKKGVKIWGFRTSAAADQTYANKCFGYADANLGKTAANNDGAHVMGCANGKTLASGCTQ